MDAWGEPNEDSPGFEELKSTVSGRVDELGEEYPAVPVSVLVAQESVAHCFLDVSKTRDLLVLGRPRARGWGRGGAGSMATTVVADANVPVMVVP